MGRLWRAGILMLLSIAAAAAADMGLEVLSLRHRQAAEVLPMIRPFLAPGANATAMNEKLFVKTTPENLAEIRRLLESMDREPRRLMIRVSQTRDGQAASTGAEVSGDLALGRNARIVQPATGGPGTRVEVRRGDSTVGARILETRTTGSASGSQSVQVVEGGRAFIQAGVSVPLPMRQVLVGPQGVVVTDTVVYRDIGQGFYAEPRIVGDRVMLDISQQADTPGGFGPGSANVQRLTTTVSGRLGEWISLGGTQSESGSDSRAPGSASTRELRDRRGLWLRVEELPSQR